MTTTPRVADRINHLWLTDGRILPVAYSLETAHQAVAVVKLLDQPDYCLAVYTNGRWERIRGVDTITEALSLVPAVVAEYLA